LNRFLFGTVRGRFFLEPYLDKKSSDLSRQKHPKISGFFLTHFFLYGNLRSFAGLHIGMGLPLCYISPISGHCYRRVVFLPGDFWTVPRGKEAIRGSGALKKLKEQWFKETFWGKEILRDSVQFLET